MYLQSAFEEKRPDVLHRHVHEHPLATFIVTVDGEIVVNHFPMVIAPSTGQLGALHGHVPRDNRIWQALDGTSSAVAVFQGADSYITPSWYPGKHAHGKAVPTWNYAVVHAHGRPIAIDDRDWLHAHLQHLTDTQESRQALPWKVSDAPADYTERMIERLVGIDMPIASLVGKWKVSQNRSEADRLGVAAGLRSRGDPHALAMAELVAGGGAKGSG